MKRNHYHKANRTGGNKKRRCSFVPKRVIAKSKAGMPAEAFYISRKRSEGDFVLVRLLGSAHYSIIRLMAIEKQVLELEMRVLQNKWELEILKRDCKLRLEGLFVELELVPYHVYRSFERKIQRLEVPVS